MYKIQYFQLKVNLLVLAQSVSANNDWSTEDGSVDMSSVAV